MTTLKTACLWGAVLLLSSVARGEPLVDAAPANSIATERSKIAVLDFMVQGVDEATTENILTLVANELQQLGVFQVITRSDLISMIGFEADKQLMGCESDMTCLTELSGALGVDHTVAGTVGRIGDTFILGLTLIRADSGKVESRVTRQATGPMALAGEVKKATRDLVGTLLEDLSGFVEVVASETGAEIRLDGKLVSVTPSLPVKFGAGPRELRISKQGFVDWASEVVVPMQHQTVRVDVLLVPSPEFVAAYRKQAKRTRLWAWVASGAALAAGAGAGTFYGLSAGNASENARALAATTEAQRNNDRATFDREAARATETQNSGEFQRGMSIGLGAVAVGVAVTAAYFWMTGDDPTRYEQTQ